MYSLTDNGVIKEVNCGDNFEYVLEDSNHFVNTDYKVLQSQTNGFFIPCMKMTRNGKVSLYYVSDEYRPMSAFFNNISPDTLITVVINLFASVIEVRNNGFLACQCIDLSWDKIFVESNTYKVKLVYLPFSVRVFDTSSEFENELRSSIVKLINKVVTSTTERLEQFVKDLCNGTLTLEDVYNRSRGAETISIASKEPERSANNFQNVHMGQSMQNQAQFSGFLKMVAMNAPSYFEIILDKDFSYIGKKPELVDKVIAFNNMISRKHCSVTRVNGVYYIMDEGSANGTYVNNAPVLGGQRVQIKKGDVIRLANSDFQIV